MKNNSEILTEIRNGTPYTYNGRLTKGRKFTIYQNNKGNLFLQCNQLKAQDRLTEKAALIIIQNDIDSKLMA